ncbi:MAG: alpha/beta hydrolase family protein [Gemmatimonadales bacterium]
MTENRYQTEEVTIPAVGATLAGTLLLPVSSDPVAALVLVSGSGANDRDETVCGQKPFLVIAEFFAERGFAVLRYDDRGVGGSTGNASAQDFDGSVSDLRSAYAWLAQHAGIASDQIIVFGHSEGGLVVTSAAPDLQAAAVIILAGPAVPIEDVLHHQARELALEVGATPGQVAHERQMNEAAFAIARGLDDEASVVARLETWFAQSLRNWPDTTALSEDLIAENARVMAGILAEPAYRSLLRQDPGAMLRRLDCPVLAVFGGKDMQVPGEPNQAAFRRATAGNTGASSRIFPDHNHLLQRAESGAISEYESLAPGPDVPVLEHLEDWVRGLQFRA